MKTIPKIIMRPTLLDMAILEEWDEYDTTLSPTENLVEFAMECGLTEPLRMWVRNYLNEVK